MMTFDFKTPWILFVIPVILAGVYFLHKKNSPAAFRFSSHAFLQGFSSHWKVRCYHYLIFLRLLVLALFLTALAGPRKVLEKTEVTNEGIDIILAVDASGSMAAEDFHLEGRRVNRLEVVKDVVQDFIGKRTSDRVALVVFAAEAYTACPLTTDYQWLLAQLDRVKLGLINEDGTAIGSALAMSLSRLKDEKQAKSKIIILLTDGVNNTGKVDPLKAADASSALGVKIYTIGAGTRGYAPYPVRDVFGREAYRKIPVEIDEATLKEIARKTEGLYFRATDTESLRKIYQEIDKLEKTEIKETGYKEYRELFGWVLLMALFLLLIEEFLKNTILRKIP